MTTWDYRAAAAVLAAGLLAGVLVSAPAGAGARDDGGEASVVASTAARDRPESVAVGHNTIFVGTTNGADGVVSDGHPALIYAFDRISGALKSTIAVAQDEHAAPSAFRGIAGMALDADARLYAADTQGRVLRFVFEDRQVRQETYATIPDLKPCALDLFGPCSPTLLDRGPLPNDLAFDADGNLYVTDSWQATVFRITPGGAPTAWFQDTRLDGNVIAANGIAVSPDGAEIFLAITGDRADMSTVYRLPRVDAPARADLQAVASWQSGGADGLVFGKSGRLYVSLFARNVISVIEPSGAEVAQLTSPLFDEPARMAFDNHRGALLVPNHAFANVRPEPRLIVAVPVHDRAAPLARPTIP